MLALNIYPISFARAFIYLYQPFPIVVLYSELTSYVKVSVSTHTRLRILSNSCVTKADPTNLRYTEYMSYAAANQLTTCGSAIVFKCGVSYLCLCLSGWALPPRSSPLFQFPIEIGVNLPQHRHAAHALECASLRDIRHGHVVPNVPRHLSPNCHRSDRRGQLSFGHLACQ